MKTCPFLGQPGNGPIKRSHAVAKREPKSPIEGRWNIVSMTAWDVEETVEELQPFIEFERNEGGQFQFGCVYGEMDCRLTERDGKPAAFFKPSSTTFGYISYQKPLPVRWSLRRDKTARWKGRCLLDCLLRHLPG